MNALYVSPVPHISPELHAFAQQAGVSPSHLAAGLADPLHFADHLDFDELAKLKASCEPAPVRRRDDSLRLLTTV